MQRTLLTFFLFLPPDITAQVSNPLQSKDFKAQSAWVEKVYSNMSLQEKIGQLFMVDIYSNGSEADKNKVRALIKEHNIGGVIFSKGGPVQQATSFRNCQKPLFLLAWMLSGALQ